MNRKAIQMISPNISLADWHSGNVEDIDVLEDQIRGWIFDPVKALTPNPHCEIAILLLVTPFSEVLNCYLTGEDSKGRSGKFLKAGLAAVFPERGRNL